MTRSRASARAAGSAFERLVADYLRAHVSEYVDRRVRTGAADKGDLVNVRAPGGGKVVAELKAVARTDLAGWAAEAEAERVNDGALVGVTIHKRVGRGKAEDQWCTMTVRDLAALLSGQRPA